MFPIPVGEFLSDAPFLDLVSGRSASWQTAHARVGGVQPLNLEVHQEMALFGVSNLDMLEQSLLKQSGTCQIQ